MLHNLELRGNTDTTKPVYFCYWISFKTSLKEGIINQNNCEAGTATEDAFTKGQYFLQHIISFNINSNPRLSRLIVEVEKSLRKLPCSTPSLTFTNYFNDDRRLIFVLSFLSLDRSLDCSFFRLISYGH